MDKWIRKIIINDFNNGSITRNFIFGIKKKIFTFCIKGFDSQYIVEHLRRREVIIEVEIFIEERSS